MDKAESAITGDRNGMGSAMRMGWSGSVFLKPMLLR